MTKLEDNVESSAGSGLEFFGFGFGFLGKFGFQVSGLSGFTGLNFTTINLIFNQIFELFDKGHS